MFHRRWGRMLRYWLFSGERFEYRLRSFEGAQESTKQTARADGRDHHTRGRSIDPMVITRVGGWITTTFSKNQLGVS